MTYSKEDLKRIDTEKKYWQKYEVPFGWVLVSWTAKYSAQFMRLSDRSTVYVGGHGYIRVQELDLIMSRQPKCTYKEEYIGDKGTYDSLDEYNRAEGKIKEVQFMSGVPPILIEIILPIRLTPTPTSTSIVLESEVL